MNLREAAQQHRKTEEEKRNKNHLCGVNLILAT